MNFFDSAILSFLGGFTQISKSLNLWILVISDNDLFKGALTMTLFWWAWNLGQGADEKRRNRQILLVTLLGAFLALFLGRALQMGLPFRFRPMNDPALNFLLPIGTEKKMENWSSFPSDHAALFFSLATGAWLLSRRGGLLCYAYVTAFICFPRAFLGLHYPTDLLAGAIVGVACTALASLNVFRERLANPILDLAERYTAPFYAAFFFLTFQLATLFDSVRDFAKFVIKGEH